MGLFDIFRKKIGNLKALKKAGKAVNLISDFKNKGIKEFFDDWEDNILISDGDKTIKDAKAFKQDIDLFRDIVKGVPKVGSIVEITSEFVVQNGYKLKGNEEDIEKIEEWNRKHDYEIRAMNRVKGQIVDGNVYYLKDGLPFKRLPTKHMRIRRDKNGEIKGYVEIKNFKVVAKWKPEDIIHLKWNAYGTEPYGTSEIKRLTNTIEKKLNMEEAEADIFENYASPIILWKLGTQETPATEDQIEEFIDGWEERLIGGDVVGPGDLNADILAPSEGIRDAIELKKDIEEQLHVGLRMPLMGVEGDVGAEHRMDIFDRRIRTFQDVERSYLENHLFPKILSKEDVPRVVWNPLNIEQKLRLARYLRQLIGNENAPPMITQNEARDELGYGEIGDLFLGVGNEESENDTNGTKGEEPEDEPSGEEED